MSEVNINKTINLSEHFTLGEVTKSKHAEVYNIPSHEAIENLKRVCSWLEELRARYNLRYVLRSVSPPELGGARGGLNEGMSGASSDHPAHTGTPSPQLNRKVGGSPTSNHLTGCAVDIRVAGIEQAMRYAVILMDYADETKQDYDEILIEKNRYGAIWLHFAVRPRDNRRKTMFLQT